MFMPGFVLRVGVIRGLILLDPFAIRCAIIGVHLIVANHARRATR